MQKLERQLMSRFSRQARKRYGKSIRKGDKNNVTGDRIICNIRNIRNVQLAIFFLIKKPELFLNSAA